MGLKIGDKVIPLKKSIWNNLEHSSAWKIAKNKKQPYLYFMGTEISTSGEEVYNLNGSTDDYCQSNHFNREDFVPYDESNIGKLCYIDYNYIYNSYDEMAELMFLDNWKSNIPNNDFKISVYKIITYNIHRNTKVSLYGVENIKTGKQYIIASRGVTIISDLPVVKQVEDEIVFTFKNLDNDYFMKMGSLFHSLLSNPNECVVNGSSYIQNMTTNFSKGEIRIKLFNEENN